jgi:hypothetical protein
MPQEVKGQCQCSNKKGTANYHLSYIQKTSKQHTFEFFAAQAR